MSKNKSCLFCKILLGEKPKKYSFFQWKNKKYCSRQCSIHGTILDGSRFLFQKGHTLSIESRKKISEKLKGNCNSGEGEQSHNWKGDKVGYGALHDWVRKEMGIPKICEHCGKFGLEKQQIHWANLSKKYLRKKYDWIRLCVSCHKKFDLGLIKL